MELKSWIKSNFLYIFRELFLYHYDSLEFRAKILASIISVDKEIDECEEKILNEIAKEIYPNNETRQKVLINTVREYVDKIVKKNGLEVYELLLDIENILKVKKRYTDKINIEYLKRVRECKRENEDIYILQLRVIEFLENRKKEYSKFLDGAK